MKSEWKIFGQLMNKEIGIGWDPIKKSIDALRRLVGNKDIHDDDSYKDTYTNDNEERSGDSHDIQNVEMQSSLHASLLGDDYLFPNSSSFKRQKSNE
ncbi:hypothetical protein Leryth_010675, partial [Lithospermum erythrorhizon]